MNEGRCIKCGSCMRACPVLSDPLGADFPGPRTLAVDVPRFPERLSVGNIALMCTMCHACEWACPSSITITRSMAKLRSGLAATGTSLPGHQRLRRNVRSSGHTVENDFQGWKDEGQRTLYFPGCISLGRLPKVTAATSKALDAMGVGHDISREAKCCGSPLLKIGAREEAEELRRNNKEVFSRYERIVTSCPGCTYHLRQEYGIEAKHVVELLSQGRWRSAVEGRWALQIPCHLKRGVSPWVAESMITLLQEAGVELVRLPEEDSCCGGGGGLLAGFPETSSSLAASKADLYRKAGVTGVITACPFCSLNLQKAGLLVLDITEALIARD